MIVSLIAVIIAALGIAALLDLNAEQITSDILALLTPHDNLKELALAAKGNKKTHRIYYRLLLLRTALESTGKGGQFALVCTSTILLFAGGAVFAVILDNVWLLPALSLAMGAVPYIYITRMLDTYERRIQDELETVLSIITISYTRTYNILGAVEENLQYIKPPLNAIFQAFLGDAMITPDVKQAILSLRERIDDQIFREWCDTLILCQSDRVLADTLQSIIGKYTDVRVINKEMEDEIKSCQVEYWTMVGFVVGNIPMLYFLNQDWYNALMNESYGKMVLGLCGIIILFTALAMFHWTKPITYKSQME